MKDCPKCHTKYTDASLKFCLQDGAALVAADSGKTEVFDQDAFSNDVTVAVSQQEMVSPAVSSEPEVETKIASAPSADTIEREPGEFGKKRSIGFLAGFLAGGLILGVLIVAGLGIWLIPGMIAGTGNTNTNVRNTGTGPVTAEDVRRITASSVRKAEKGNLYIPENILDSDVRTAWGEGVKGTGIGEWIKIEFEKKLRLSEVLIKPGYFKNASIWKKNNRVASVELLFSTGKSRVFDFPDEMKIQKIELDNIDTSFVKIKIREIHAGSSDTEDTLISEIGFIAAK